MLVSSELVRYLSFYVDVPANFPLPGTLVEILNSSMIDPISAIRVSLATLCTHGEGESVNDMLYRWRVLPSYFERRLAIALPASIALVNRKAS